MAGRFAGAVQSWRSFFGGESWRTEVRRRLAPAFYIGLAVSALFGALVYLDAFSQLENRTVDWRFGFREVRTVSPQDAVVILAIDDQSLQQLNLRWPMPRGLFGRVIDRLSEAGARVVALDFVFSEEGTGALKAQDRLLSEAIIRSRSWIVMAGKFVYEDTETHKRRQFIAPIPNLDPRKTHVGFVDMFKDDDGVIRRAPMIQRLLKKPYPSFALKILDRYFNFAPPEIVIRGDWLQYGQLLIPAEGGVMLRINFRGGPGNFRTVSMENILDDQVFAGLRAKGVFQDKIVLVGPTFSEAQDLHATPYPTKEFGLTPGVEIHANILDTILNRNYLWPLPKPTVLAMIFGFVLACALISIRLRPLFGPVVMVVVIFALWVLAFAAFMQGNLILPLFLPTLAIAAATLSVMVYRVLTEERRSRQIKTIFSRYVSPKVVEELVKNPQAALALGGNKQVVTVLFSDIRNFTGMSEQMQPEEVVDMLNAYFQAMTEVIFLHDGTVDKFIGDAIMAVFGAPVGHPDDPIRAVRTGLDMLRVLDRISTKWALEGRRTFKIGVGINTGEAIVGNMGSYQAMGYTVIGDTVNLASRLEGLNKELQTSLLISESTYALVRDHIEAREHAGVHVKGKADELTVYEVLGRKERRT